MYNFDNISRLIARSHMYWGRKPIIDLLNIFETIKDGDIVMDPFCGGGNPAIAALLKGGRVIAGDLNPMAVFLTKVLIRPINLAILKSAFEDVATSVSHNILEKYEIKCPKCKKTGIIKSLVWSNKNNNKSIPESAHMECNGCHKIFFTKLSSAETKRQQKLSKMTPTFWFPQTTINSTRKSPVEHHYELFTGRNLSMLAELLHAIKQVSSENMRDAMLYVFTAILYSCSSMQMFSEKEPSSSRGWQALRFYIPPKRKEVNVWNAFERRFDNFIKCKGDLNHFLRSVRVTNSTKDFHKDRYEILITNEDAFDLIHRFGHQSNMIFLDPPYIDDIDYFAFSEFWGTWLEMKFNFDKEWHPRRKKAELLIKLLKSLKEVTSESCEICLAFAPKRQKGWNEEDCIEKSKYHIKRTGFFSYDNSNKRGVINNQSNRFTILESKKTKKSKLSSQISAPISMSEDNLQQLAPYLRVMGHLYPKEKKSNAEPHRETSSFDKIRTYAAKLVPERLSTLLMNLKDADIEEMVSNKEVNKNTYHSLCCFLLRIILSKDGWKISYVDPAQFEDKIFGMILQEENCISSPELPEGITFVAQNDNKKILFCFDDQDPIFLKKVAKKVADSDKDEYQTLCMMIVRNKDKMNERRRFAYADEWARGFFLYFEAIQRKAEKLNTKKYSKLFAHSPIPQAPKLTPIMSVTAEVKDNIPVGENRNHYKLRFKSTRSFNIIPGQFIMIDTLPQRQDIMTDPIELIEPAPYLKRPFGIHRAFYRYFSEDEDNAYSKTSSIAYLKKMLLPHELATVLHTVFPNKFEIFYKVLPNGIGTKKLSELKLGDRIQILGPLGNGTKIRELSEEGFNEIHLIGGGVGMAPLIFIVQALRYYSFKVKAFIGIEKIEMLKYKRISDGLEQSFNEEDPTIYIDDLIETGLGSSDIFVSNTEADSICKKLPKENIYKGFVSDQYEDYLLRAKPIKNILAFACGPSGMMKALVPIANKYGIPLKVLMEKRMACGIGVCLSCVCETKTKTGEEKYSRVCTDGPIFDSSEVIWK